MAFWQCRGICYEPQPRAPFTIDLAPYVGASLEVMAADSRRMRGSRPFVFTNLKTGEGLNEVIRFIRHQGMLDVRAELG